MMRKSSSEDRSQESGDRIQNLYDSYCRLTRLVIISMSPVRTR